MLGAQYSERSPNRLDVWSRIDRVEVTVSLTQPTRLLALLGIDERTVTATVPQGHD